MTQIIGFFYAYFLNKLFIFSYNKVPELNEIGEEIERDYMFEKMQALDQSNIPEEEKNLKSSNSTEHILIDINIKIKVLIIQNIGIILGFSFMLLMAIYSENIKL